jgi:hypothetical protein
MVYDVTQRNVNKDVNQNKFVYKRAKALKFSVFDRSLAQGHKFLISQQIPHCKRGAGYLDIAGLASILGIAISIGIRGSRGI